MKTSLKKLFKVCCPSGPPKDPEQGESFLKALQESEWFNQVLFGLLDTMFTFVNAFTTHLNK